MTPVANLPPVSTNRRQNCRRYQRHQWHFATGITGTGGNGPSFASVVDTGGKFATGINGKNIRLQTP
jgi:hypothetical protein